MSALPVLLWAVLLAALGTMLALWTHDDVVAVALLPAAVLVALLIAVGAARAREPRERVVPEASVSGPLAACGLTGLAIGAVAGLWAALIGVGLLVLALIAAARERSG